MGIPFSIATSTIIVSARERAKSNLPSFKVTSPPNCLATSGSTEKLLPGITKASLSAKSSFAFCFASFITSLLIFFSVLADSGTIFL